MKRNLLSLIALFIVSIGSKAQNCSELFISEYVEGSHNNKALEIYNPTNQTIDLTKYRVTRWQNGQAPVPPPAQFSDTLTGTIGPNEVRVAVLDRRNPSGTGVDTQVFADLKAKANIWLSKTYSVSFAMSFNGDDALSLDKKVGNEWIPVEIFGKIGEQPKLSGNSRVIGWSDSFPHSTGLGTWYTIDKTLIRKPSVKKGITQNPTVFNPKTEWKLNPENMFDSLGTHRCECNQYPAKTTGINETAQVQVFPNPAANHVMFIAPFEIQSLKIYTLSGQLINVVYQTETVNGYRVAKADIKGLRQGIYFAEIAGKNGLKTTSRVVVE